MIIKRILIILLLCCCMLSGCSRGPVFLDTNGNTVQLEKLRGKWIIINYWATWCHNCVKEIPELNNFYQDNKDKNILLYGVNFDGSDDIQNAIKQANIKFPVLLENPDQAWNLGELSAVPVTFIIDPNGKLVKTIYGPNTEISLSDILANLKKNFI